MNSFEHLCYAGAECLIEFFDQALVILCFRIVVNAYKQHIVRIITVTVSAEIFLFLNLIHGFFRAPAVLEFYEENRKAHASFRSINHIGASFAGLQFPDALVLALGTPHETGYQAEHH